MKPLQIIFLFLVQDVSKDHPDKSASEPPMQADQGHLKHYLFVIKHVQATLYKQYTNY